MAKSWVVGSTQRKTPHIVFYDGRWWYFAANHGVRNHYAHEFCKRMNHGAQVADGFTPVFRYDDWPLRRIGK